MLGVALAAVTPGGSYLAALPALAGSIGVIVAIGAGPTRRTWLAATVLVIGGAVAVVILAPTVSLFFPALGLATGGAAAFFAAMLALALLPLVESLYSAAAGDAPVVEPPRRRLRGSLPAIVAAALTVAFVATGFAVDQFGARYPAPAQLMYALDADTGKAQWVSTDTSPGDWTRRYVTGRGDVSRSFPIVTGEVDTGPATAANLPAPTIATTADTTDGGTRTVSLTVTSHRTVRLVDLRVEGATVLRATVDGRPVPASVLGNHFGVEFHAPPDGGLPVTLVLNRTGPVRIRVMDGSDGLDGLPGFTPRPSGVGVKGSHDTELAMVAKTYTI